MSFHQGTPRQPDPWSNPQAQPTSGLPTSGPPLSGPPGYGAAGYGGCPPSPDERTMATLGHVLAIFFGVLGALIIYLVKKDESRYVRHHAAEALNLTLTSLFVTLGVSLLGCLLTFVVIGVFLFLLLIPYAIVLVIFMIMAAVAANRGEWYEYPAWLRFPMVR